MQEPAFYIITAAFSLIGITVISLVALRGWRDWITLKARELDMHKEDHPPSATSRIEVADLKERIRKLESIAAGVEL
ncbi:hypothetical protein MNBD_ALPHA04-1675 [hydrothermal vent metagenome]|uniref:Uncharacterized protein n=1 Tax=hydrothermal vent metagenome TaxID=652676 RepID=A0A3B0RNZ6_9ZZZZ